MKQINSLLVSLLLSLVVELSASQERSDSVRKSIDSFAKLQDKEVSEVDRLKKMFKKGEASGQLKLMYASAPQADKPYATAMGGIFKYELAEYRGFNVGAAAYISYDLPFASGKGIQDSSELSSREGKYIEMGEAYLNYKYDNFSFRGGRQVIDTPLADSDDIRMIKNSFEAYILNYDYNGMKFMAGNIQNWNGYDAGLDNGWVKTGTKGVNFGGLSYAHGLEYDLWYYNVTGVTNAAYVDLGIEYHIDEDILIHSMVQYLHEDEVDNSGVEASIYGFLAEVVVNGIGMNLSLNKAEKCKDKESFSGFGGGTLFTNMDTMIPDTITKDREVLSYVAGVSYEYEGLNFLYTYGDFNGEEDSGGIKAHIVEQNIGMGYNVNEEIIVGVLYAAQEDLEDSLNNWDRAQVMLSYNFK
jgi:hypothetical protein